LSAEERRIDTPRTDFFFFFRFRKTPPMDGDENFWLHLTRLADSYQAGGATPAERAAAALLQFNDMPPAVQREVLVAMRSAVTELADLYAVAAAKSDGAGLGSERRGKARAR
jgi:hypothetical protein